MQQQTDWVQAALDWFGWWVLLPFMVGVAFGWIIFGITLFVTWYRGER